MPRTVLLEFTHGLGDSVQFSVVLKHLSRFRPDWVIDVVAGRGKHSALRGLCRAVYFDGQPRPPKSSYTETRWVGWYENYNGYADRPNSKITNCLAEEFGIPYVPELGSYTVNTAPEERSRAASYLESIGCRKFDDGRYNAIALHYEGNTSVEKKNLPHNHARAVIDTVAAAGYHTVLLDWDHRSPHHSLTTVHNPGCGAGDLWGGFGSGDAGMLAALIEQCSGFVGIDSGPGKVASATSTPCVIAWTGHHPLQFHDPASGTLHLVPDGHTSQPPLSGDTRRRSYFESAYRFRTYRPDGLGFELCQEVKRRMTGQNTEFTGELVDYGPFHVRARNFDQDLVIVHDVYHGDCYRTSLYDLTQWSTVVDVGGHIGTFSSLVHLKNPACRIAVVEACPENINALTENVGVFATIVQGAMTYEPGELALLNAVRDGCESTGGSVVVSRDALADIHHPLRQHGYQYWDDLRPLRKVTLRDVMDAAGLTHIDCLKLDCEGAEFSILEHAPELARVRFIFGEYHDRVRWEDLRARKFADWPYGLMHEEHGRGLFHLVNPRFDPLAPIPEISAKTSEPEIPMTVAVPEGVTFQTEGRSYSAIYNELTLRNADLTAVAGYRPAEPSYPTTAAVRWYCVSNGHRLSVQPDGTAIINRRFSEETRCGRDVLRIAVAAGIGDTAWVATKIPALLKLLGAAGVDLVTCDGDRANAYLSLLPFVRRVESTSRCLVETEPHVLPDGSYHYAPSQPGWHGEYDFVLQANGHLECGGRLEEWLPKLATDYTAPISYGEISEDTVFADIFAARGPFVTVFAANTRGNTVEGHNIGGRWTPRDWATVSKRVTRRGIRIVLLGSGPGDDDYALRCLHPAGFFDYGAEDYVSRWELPRTLAVLRRSAGHIGYQSGLGVLSTYLGKPAAMFWQEDGVKLNPAGATFREAMATAWVPPETLKAGRYLGVIYGRTTAQEVSDFIVSQVVRDLKEKQS